MKHVIIGGVAGGATAAARIRRADESAEIILFEKASHISYANCGLPYYIGGVIADRNQLFLQTPVSFKRRFEIDVRVESEVTEIDSLSKMLTICKRDGTVYKESFDKLLLSPGALALKPPLEGIDLEGIFTLRDVNDTDVIKQYLTSHSIQTAVVVGAGFIGLEMAENLQRAGADVSIIEMGDQVMAPLDYSMASMVHQHLLHKGVQLYLGQSVERFSKQGKQIDIYTKQGEKLTADMVILSIGVRPETGLAKQAGLTIGETGGIWVDSYLETSTKDIYAVGDAIEFPHPITGQPWLNYLANPANRQGRIVADNMVFGNQTAYEGAIGTCIAKVFDMTVAATGLAAKMLEKQAIAFYSSTTHSSSHAGYYPGALPLSIKLTFHPENGILFGAQCVGYEGVDKRIDQLALLIKQKGTIFDLMKLEHAYAPPFSSAKDPAAIAGYVAANILSNVMPVITWREMQKLNREEVCIIDVRTLDEFSMGCIDGAVNIPVDELRSRINEVPQNKPVYVYCAIGLRGYLALKILAAHGYTQLKNLSGGYKTYSSCLTPLKKEPVHAKKDSEQAIITNEIKMIQVNACGLQCPGPIIKVKQAIDSIGAGSRLEIKATDAGFSRDAEAWCNTTGNQIISNNEDKGVFTVIIEKGAARQCETITSCDDKGKTFIVFSDELDKALAAFVLANGAAATGKKVTLFFTFWGLNVIKKVKKPKTEKDLFGKMFSFMLPSSSLKLKLSKMSMGGLGGRMMRMIMKRKGIESLENLRRQALDQGVEFIACQMSMDVMGVKREELLDEVTVGGVATYMERADKANVNLFI